MARYIDAERIKYDVKVYGWQKTLWTTKEVVDAVPDADVAPVIHGHWIYKFQQDDHHFFECSVCGRFEKVPFKADINTMPHCHCGAKMDERSNEDADCESQ